MNLKTNNRFVLHLSFLLTISISYIKSILSHFIIFYTKKIEDYPQKIPVGFFKQIGADMVGMTLVPEAFLAKELEMCYGAICYITNYAEGIKKCLIKKACSLKEHFLKKKGNLFKNP
ncbi:MAG: hypothetical protein AABY58_05295 [Nitrospirota bacterium]